MLRKFGVVVVVVFTIILILSGFIYAREKNISRPVLSYIKSISEICFTEIDIKFNINFGSSHCTYIGEKGKGYLKGLQWSPDGKSMLFYSSSDDGMVIIPSIDFQSKLVLGKDYYSLRSNGWSQDSKKIFFLASDYKRRWHTHLLVTYDVKNGQSTVQEVRGDTAIYSPDSSKIVLVSYGGYNRNGSTALYFRDKDTVKNIPLPISVYSMSWAPSNLEFVFSGYYQAKLGIYIYSVYDGSIRIVENTPARYVSHPSWSPDGRYIAYINMAGTVNYIVLYSVKSGTKKILNAKGANPYESPSWSPDSTYIAYRSENTLYDKDTIRILNIENNQEIIVAKPGYSTSISWKPNAKIN